MTQESKDLLLRDLCARLPYGVKIWNPWNSVNTLVGVDLVDDECEGPFCLKNEDGLFNYYAGDIKPYLRPMSSMTEEEWRECVNLGIGDEFEDSYGEHRHLLPSHRLYDWLNAHHFDYKGLIEKGLAISTETFNPYKN